MRVKCQVISIAQNTAFVHIIGSRFRGKVDVKSMNLKPGQVTFATINKIDTHEPPRINLDSPEVCDVQSNENELQIQELIKAVEEI